MIILFEAIMTLVGAVTLLRGKFFMPPRTRITGWRATAIGLFLLLPLPVTIIVSALLSLLINQGIVGINIVRIGTVMETALVVSGLLGALVVATLPHTREELAEQDEAQS